MENELAELMMGEFPNWKTSVIKTSENFTKQMLVNIFSNDIDIDIDKIMPIVYKTLDKVITIDNYLMFKNHLTKHYTRNLSQEQMKSLYEFCKQNSWYPQFISLQSAEVSEDMLKFNQFISEEIQKALTNSEIE